MNDQIETPKKSAWPRTEHGTIDWELVFERPDDGLIALVEEFNSADGVMKVCKVIIHALFSRDSDAENRVRFEREVNEIMVNANDPNHAFALEPRKILIIELLREVKQNRVLNASFHIARMKEDAKSKADPSKRRTDEPAADTGADQSATPDRDAPEYPEDAFVFALTEMLAHRMEALSKGVNQEPLLDRPLPFPVSQAFSQRMLSLVRDHMAGEMQTSCRTFIRKSENQPREKQVDYIVTAMESRESRQVLWASWQDVWNDLTQQREPPKKPKEEKKKGLLGKFKKQEARPSYMGKALTMDEWEDAVAMTKQANTLAARLWSEMTAASDAFQPPTDADNKLLMNFFARTPGAMGKQIKAVRQIVEQGGNLAKVFADYQQGKDIDLPLLSAICQRPDLFFDQGILKDIMRSFPDSMRRDRFALVSRYFGDQF